MEVNVIKCSMGLPKVNKSYQIHLISFLDKRNAIDERNSVHLTFHVAPQRKLLIKMGLVEE